MYILVKRNMKALIFIIVMIIINLSANAQVTQQNNPANINISAYSNEQILAMLKLYNLSELSAEELSIKAAEAGFTKSQIEELKIRFGSETKQNEANKNEPGQKRKDIKLDKSSDLEKSKLGMVYGFQFFESEDNIFKPDLKMATPGYYKLGPGDKLILNIFGDSEVKYELLVSPEGYVNIPFVGPVLVNGITIDQVRLLLAKQLSTVYPSIKSGKTSFQIFLKDIRTIRVTLIGEVLKPAMYNLSSLSTIASALHETGGPSNLGSMRSVDLIRAGKLLITFDFYDFLQRGDLTKNLLLMDGDVVRVNPYQTKLYLGGSVKRAGYYELSKGEDLNHAIIYAGGLSDHANQNLLTIYRMGKTERAIFNLDSSEINQFVPRSSDSVVVNSILNRFSNRVIISGSVYYPGDYSLNQTPTLEMLLNKAKLRENTSYSRAIIIRKKENFTDSIINFNVLKIIKGIEIINLIREDRVIIYAIDSLTEKYTVQITGEVNKPGSYDYVSNLRLSDLILMAGGLKEGASGKRVEIGRRIRSNGGAEVSEDSYAIVKIIDIDKNLIENLKFDSGLLEPFDIVSVRKLPDYKEQLSISVTGEVLFPGNYVIRNRNERLSDIVDRAGGLKPGAAISGAVLMRYRKPNPGQVKAQENKLSLLDSKMDSLGVKTIIDSKSSADFGPVGIKLDRAIENKGGEYDIFLEPGDSLFIPTPVQTVQVFGAVNNSVKIVYSPQMKFRDVVQQSGGFDQSARRSGSYVINMNGQTFGTQKFLLFRKYPFIEPGTDIYVPMRKENKLRLTDVMGIGTTVSGILTLLFLIK
jgi:protein involved in polysaccharide export with SLBB domain